MSPTALKIKVINELSSIYDQDEASAIAGELFDFYKVGSASLIDPGSLELIESALERLTQNEPLQYVLGEAWFYNLPFYVNRHVLIPRPETEELVYLILSDIQHSTLRILDMGTGSGCIPIALKANIPEAEVFGLDISLDALGVAKQNALHNGVEVKFFQADMLNPDLKIPVTGFDIIVSNPPYITEQEKEAMHANVLAHEPNLALFVTNGDPLQFYEKIASFAAKNLKRGGKLYVEINAGYAKEVKDCFEQHGFSEVRIISDMQGKDRIVSGYQS